MSQEIGFVIDNNPNKNIDPTQIEGYKSHWKKTISFWGLGYSVTQIVLLPDDSNSVLSLLSDTRPSERKLGKTSIPILKPVVYYAPTPWQFSRYTEVASGNCCLRYKLQDSYYSVPRTPLMNALTVKYGNQDIVKSEDKNVKYSLKLTGPEPDQCSPALAEPFVVLPGNDFSSAFCLNISVSAVRKSQNIELPIGKPIVDEVSVEFLELITAVKFKKGSKIKRFNKMNSEVVFVTKGPFQVHEVSARSGSSNSTTFEISPSSYSFPIPSLGPTFFTSSLMRSYAVKVNVKLSVNGSEISLISFADLKVATTRYRKEISIDKTFQRPTSSSKWLVSTFCIQHFPKTSFRPLDLDTSSKWIEKCYKVAKASYVTVQTEKMIYVMSCQRLIVPSSLPNTSSVALRERYGFKRFGNEPKVDHGECYLISEVVKGSGISEFPKCDETPQGGLFLRFEGNRIGTGFAPGIPEYCSISQPIGCSSIPIIGNRCRLWISFKKTSLFHDYVGNTVIPGMRLADFISIGVTIRDSGTLEIHMNPIAVDVELWESIIANPEPSVNASQKTQSMLKKQFGENISLYRWVNGSLTYLIPSRFYDCEIPNVGPTFCTKELRRFYHIVISFQFITSWGNRYFVTARVPVTIAKDYCNCLE
ncbi:hypothetical protein FT663_02508 [Candidozyma haemuli var. vulneris]|nr:hypothetical protein FT663_02508 [[Candida] haemuloni var. vulneris]